MTIINSSLHKISQAASVGMQPGSQCFGLSSDQRLCWFLDYELVSG